MPKASKIKKKSKKIKSITKVKSKNLTKTKEMAKGPIKISKTYVPKETEKYMCEKHKIFYV